jgi:hypothetical protein
MFATGKIIGKMKVVDCMTTKEAIDRYVTDVNKHNTCNPGKKGREIWLKAAGESLGKRAFIIEDPVHFDPDDYIPCKGKVFPLFFDVEI